MDDTGLAIGFVRNVLGCRCPDEVIRDLRISREAAGPLPWLRLNVGGRLLVCVPESDDGAELVRLLPEICAGMRQERDRGGFNRVRIVLKEPGDPETRLGMERAFAAAAAGDQRMLLHMLPPELLAPIIAQGRAEGS